MVRMEVRCCCEPKKLLGWVDLDVERVFDGAVVELSTFSFDPLQGPMPIRSGLRLTVAEVMAVQESRYPGHEPVTSRYLALKADGISLEKIKMVEGFIPA